MSFGCARKLIYGIYVKFGLLFTYIHTRHEKRVKITSFNYYECPNSICLAHCMNQRSLHLLEMCAQILYSLAMILYSMAHLAWMALGLQLRFPLNSDLINYFKMFPEIPKVIIFVHKCRCLHLGKIGIFVLRSLFVVVVGNLGIVHTNEVHYLW